MAAENVAFVMVAGFGVGLLTLFGMFRRRGNQFAWAPTGTGSTDRGYVPDPDIARRIAALLGDGDDDAPARRLPDQADPTGDDAADAGAPTTVAGTRPAPARIDPETGPPAETSGEESEPAFDPAAMLQELLVDPVSGLGSRLAWDRWIADESARVRRYRRPTTLVVAEVSGLDAVAAFLGADVAVQIVAAIADILRANVRSSDHAALVGPARFAVLLPETDEVRAVNFVERVRASCDRWLGANASTVSIGFGWASPGATGDLAAAEAVADRRLAVDLSDAPTGTMRS